MSPFVYLVAEAHLDDLLGVVGSVGVVDGSFCLGLWPECAGLAPRPTAAQVWAHWAVLVSPVPCGGRESVYEGLILGQLGSRGTSRPETVKTELFITMVTSKIRLSQALKKM